MAHPHAFPTLLPPPPREGAIACVGIALDGDAAAWIEAATPFVTQSEQAQARRFRQVQDAARHLLGRALVRRVLGAAFGRPFSGEFALGPWGKPACPPEWLDGGNAMDFSISHSGRMVWTAFCRTAAVGIDVEQISPLPDAFELAAQLHPLECAAVRAQPEPDRAVAFHRCWTRKEAVLKALGMGLNLPLQGFLVRPDPGDADWLVSLPAQTAQAAPCATWTTRDIDAGPGYQCSVAASAPNLPLTVFFQ